MNTEERAFADWYRKHAKTAEGRKDGPPDDLRHAIKKLPADRDRPFHAPQYANAAGRWAALATAATFGRVVYDAGVAVSISKPPQGPAWLNERLNERRWRETFWTDLERMTCDGHDTQFASVLRRVHLSAFIAASSAGEKLMAELGPLLAGVLQPTMLALQASFDQAFRGLPDGAFMRVVWPNVFIPIVHWYAFQLIGDRTAADALRATIEEFSLGLPIGGQGGSVYGPHPLVVLTY